MKLSLRLALALSDLTEAIKLKFSQQMAVAAGLAATDFARVSVVYTSTVLRRLLQTAVKADVTISLPDQATASAAVSSLTESNINKAMVIALVFP